MNKENFLVTVYITNFNYGKFIKQAIESVLMQTEQSFELIIIDDGSTDNSKEIIEKYKDLKNIRIVYQKNKGLNVTNNIALRAARGKYIVRLDADDYFSPNALELLLEKLESDSMLGMVFPDYFLVDTQGEVLERQKRHDFDNEVKLFDQAAHGACTMIRVQFLREIGGYDESFSCQDGYELWVKFTSKFKVSNINEPLFYYRKHGKNLTSNEDRILDTRATINSKYVKKFNKEIKSVAIIPVRGEGNDIYKLPFGSHTLLEEKINQALESNFITKVIVTSPDENIKQLINDKYENLDKVSFFYRDKSKTRINVDLNSTLELIVEKFKNLDFKAITILAIEFPFLKPSKIDDAINTMVLFDADSLISVRNTNKLLFRHNGRGMNPILGMEKFTKMEREMLYFHSGGISVSTRKNFEKNNKMLSGKVGHILLDQKSAFEINTEFDMKIATLIKNDINTQ
jgi:glycosyltransferase involved in cell wall biosynthesis